MWTYTPPLRDMQFVIEDVLDAPARWREVPAFAELDADTARMVLEEGGKFASGVLAPINAAGDLQGCRWNDGAVRTPDGYVDAYRAYVEGGWAALACDAELGGQGLPELLNAAFTEMIVAANPAWTMYPGLLHGAYECLKAHGSAAQKERYLTKIVSGEWLATMNLTEPQAGSDLGLVRTKAEPHVAAQALSAPAPRGDAQPARGGPAPADDSYRITGTKIFISGGEQDLTDNIVHLVLCRLPDAPAGSRGLSLMLAPKILPDGTRNAIRCDGIEKKMGVKGSATCVMTFDGATGWLVGAPNKGLAAMFVMMNSARLHVGLQGLAFLEIAAQNALAYSRERLQGRAALPKSQRAGTPSDAAAADANAKPRSAQAGAQPIANHPAVRRTLWSLRAVADAERVIAYETALSIDDARHHPDATRRAEAEAQVSLLTPVLKAFLTAHGHHGANDALQLWGGHGYVHDYGIEQAVRDSRISMIYEGTNEIQAIDLMQRKVLDDGARQLSTLLERVERTAAALTPELADFAAALRRETGAVREATAALLAGREQDPEWPLRVADDYLHGIGHLLLAWAWARIASVAAPKQQDPWYAQKLQAARFGVQWLLPQARVHWQRVLAREAALPWV